MFSIEERKLHVHDSSFRLLPLDSLSGKKSWKQLMIVLSLAKNASFPTDVLFQRGAF